MTTLWIVCPVYFDVESFLVLRSETARELARVTFPTPERLRFVVVDDTGARDAAVEQLHGLPDVIVVHAPFNLGHQRALVFGLRTLAPDIEADDWIVTLDADGEDQPSDLGRMLQPLAGGSDHDNRVVLAWRVRRRESLSFKLLYLGFKVMFRILTGTVIRTGNYAAFRGRVGKQLLFHPAFDLSYSSALLSLNVPAVFVPCERGTRYSGHSKMGFSRLIMHGLRMLMPFIDRIATRALIVFSVVFVTGLIGAALVLSVKLFTNWAIPGWTSPMLLLVLALSFSALGNFVILFVLFAQSGGFSLRGLHGQAFGITATDARNATAGAGASSRSVVLASPQMDVGPDRT